MFLAAVVKAHLPSLPEGADSRAPDDNDAPESEATDSETRTVRSEENPTPARTRWL